LLVDQPEVMSQRVSLKLPEGKHVRRGVEPVSLETPYGSYRWSAREAGGNLIIEEALSMPQQRVRPDQYAAFGDFARAVDRAQSQELVVGP
jgi:hypothetical protein